MKNLTKPNRVPDYWRHGVSYWFAEMVRLRNSGKIQKLYFACGKLATGVIHKLDEPPVGYRTVPDDAHDAYMKFVDKYVYQVMLRDEDEHRQDQVHGGGGSGSEGR